MSHLKYEGLCSLYEIISKWEEKRKNLVSFLLAIALNKYVFMQKCHTETEKLSECILLV